jgi:hypothetical protein
MTRTIYFPVTYTIHGYLLGRQQPRSYLFAEMAEVSITDVAPEDAPVAVSWKVPISSRDVTPWHLRRMWAFDTDQRQHTRFYDGRHWLTVLADQPFHDAPSAPLAASEFAARAESGFFNSCLGFAVPTKGQRKFEVVQQEPSDRFMRNYDSARRYALALANGLEFISVDDVLYVKAAQPCYRLAPFADSSGGIAYMPVVHHFTSGERRPFDKTRVASLPISMRDEIIRRCRSANTLSDASHVGQFEWPEVHLPESMSADYDLEMEADYYVQEFQAGMVSRCKSTCPLLDSYFRQTSPAHKLSYLLRWEHEFKDMSSGLGISTRTLFQAIDALDGISIELPLPPMHTAQLPK